MRKADIQASLTAAEIPWTPDMTIADLLRRKAAAEHDPASMSRAEISKLTIATMRELVAIHGVPELPAKPPARHLDYVNSVFSLNKAAFAAEQAAVSRVTMDVFGHVAKFIKSHRDKLSFAMAVGDRAAIAHLTSRERFAPKQVTYVNSGTTYHADLTRKFMGGNADEIAQVATELNPADHAAVLAAFSDTEHTQADAHARDHMIFSSFRADDVFAARPAPPPPAGAGSDVRVQVISFVTSWLPGSGSYAQNRQYYIRDPDFPYVMLHVYRSVGYVAGRSPGDICIGYHYTPVSRKKKEELSVYMESPDSVATLDRFSVGIGWLQRYLPAMWQSAGTVRLCTKSCTGQKPPFTDWHNALVRKINSLNKRRRRYGR